LIVAYILFYCCLALAAAAMAGLALGASSRHWPRTPGVILDVETFGVRNNATEKRIVIAYEYRVGHKRFISHRIGMDIAATYSQATADRLQKKYPRNATADVYYHPTWPSLAVLEPGVRQKGAHWLLFLSFSIAGLLIGLSIYADKPFILLETARRLLE